MTGKDRVASYSGTPPEPAPRGEGGWGMEHATEPVELTLCEQRHVTLRPDTPYVLRVMPGCEECERIAREATTPTCASCGAPRPDGAWTYSPKWVCRACAEQEARGC